MNTRKIIIEITTDEPLSDAELMDMLDSMVEGSGYEELLADALPEHVSGATFNTTTE